MKAGQYRGKLFNTTLFSTEEEKVMVFYCLHEKYAHAITRKKKISSKALSKEIARALKNDKPVRVVIDGEIMIVTDYRERGIGYIFQFE